MVLLVVNLMNHCNAAGGEGRLAATWRKRYKKFIGYAIEDAYNKGQARRG